MPPKCKCYILKPFKLNSLNKLYTSNTLQMPNWSPTTHIITYIRKKKKSANQYIRVYFIMGVMQC